MRVKRKIEKEYIVIVLTMLLVCSFTIFTTYTWGKYIMLVCMSGIAIVDMLNQNGKYRCEFGPFFIMMIVFASYSGLSALWAQNASDAIEKGKTLYELLIMVFILYSYYFKKENGVQSVLQIIKWSSFFIVLYSIMFYGVDTLVSLATAEERMDSTYANVNTIGMLAAVGTLIQINEMFEGKKLSLASFMCIPAIILLALTQSRKALVILFAGTAMVLFLRSVEKKDIGKKFIRLIVSIVVIVILLEVVSSLQIFSGIMNRMERLTAGITGVGKVDNSTRVRTVMIRLGWNQFLETPILGMGMGNPHLIADFYLGKDAYLHNNFIELLAGGGIVGFSLYYIMYVYLFGNFWKYRKYKNKEYIICLTIMTMFLLMDYGRVSYYSKISYIFFLLYFLEVKKLRNISHKSV